MKYYFNGERKKKWIYSVLIAAAAVLLFMLFFGKSLFSEKKSMAVSEITAETNTEDIEDAADTAETAGENAQDEESVSPDDASDNKVEIDSATKTDADVDASEIDVSIAFTPDKDNKVLYLGSLCEEHGLTESALCEALSLIAENANIDYVFEGQLPYGADAEEVVRYCNYINTDSGKQYKVRTAEKEEGKEKAGETVYITDSRKLQGNISKSQQIENLASLKGNVAGDADLCSNAHANAYAFAWDIVNHLNGNDYDTIILSFDNFTRLAQIGDVTDNEALVFRKAAELLRPYYENNKVIWLTPNGSLGKFGNYTDMAENLTSFLNLQNAKYIPTIEGYNSFYYAAPVPSVKYISKALRSKIESDEKNVKQFLCKQYATKCYFQTMALFDPATYLKYTNISGQPNQGRLPESSEWNRNNEYEAEYTSPYDIHYAYKASVSYDTVIISDYLNTGLGLEENGAEVYCFFNSAWEKIASEPRIIVNGKYLSVIISNPDIVRMPLKVILHCSAKGDAAVNIDQGSGRKNNVTVKMESVDGRSTVYSASSGKIEKTISIQ